MRKNFKAGMFVQVFVPTITDQVGASVQPSYNVSVRWDLLFSPPDTETVWSYGEGQCNSLIASADALVKSVYVVGRQVYKWTTEDLPGYGFYWLTEPPRYLLNDPTALAESISKLFPQLAEYFEQTGSTYRVFLRKSPRGYGGSAFQWSFILEWDHGVRIGRSEDDKMGQEDDLYFLISHDMVHNWPTMEGPADGAEDRNSTWYEEGEHVDRERVVVASGS
jgi:predicted metalloprotease with PDZ domain